MLLFNNQKVIPKVLYIENSFKNDSESHPDSGCKITIHDLKIQVYLNYYNCFYLKIIEIYKCQNFRYLGKKLNYLLLFK